MSATDLQRLHEALDRMVFAAGTVDYGGKSDDIAALRELIDTNADGSLIPAERYSALVEIGAAIDADLRHNNHHTAEPIFLVEQRRRIYGMDSDYTDEFEWLSEEGSQIDDTRARRLEALYQGGCIDSEHRGYRRACYIDRWEFVQPFFTRQAAQSYIDANAHRMTDPRIMVDSAYRNPEWQAIRRLALDVAALKEVSSHEPE